jgi:hypothetical protein
MHNEHPPASDEITFLDTEHRHDPSSMLTVHDEEADVEGAGNVRDGDGHHVHDDGVHEISPSRTAPEISSSSSSAALDDGEEDEDEDALLGDSFHPQLHFHHHHQHLDHRG